MTRTHHPRPGGPPDPAAWSRLAAQVDRIEHDLAALAGMRLDLDTTPVPWPTSAT